ncbi:MAG: glycosyltransferase [Planctomycetales bacterium]|nr:glycosyltransferase [Planctomycetales bacterium]
MATPRVSVLLPVRDGAETLPEALGSLLSQTLRDLEVVAVDDGSRDGTAAILGGAAAKDPRVRIVATGGRGLVAALNLGLAESRGTFVARMDADDVSHPERLAEQVALLDARPDVGVASCLVRIVREGGVAPGFKAYERWLNSCVTPEEIAREIFVESPVPHPTALMRREELVALGGYRDPPWAEDYDLWLRYHVAGRAMAKVPLVLLDWRDHDGRLSRVDPRYRRDRFVDAKAHYLVRGPLAGRPEALVWGAGPIGKRLARGLRREGVAVPAFVDVDPRKVGRKAPGGAAVVDPDALARFRGTPLLVAVGVRGARALIRGALAARGWTEGSDFWCAA